MTMKTKKTLQHIAAVAVVLLTLCLVFAAPVSADGEDSTASQSFVAYVGDTGYESLEYALDNLSDGSILKLVTGSYDAFEIDVPNVTITGYDTSTEITVKSTTDTAFIGICKDGVTVSGLKFIIPETVGGNKVWLTSVVGFASSQYNYGGVEPVGWDVVNCEFVQQGDTIGIAIFNSEKFVVNGCTFENFGTGIAVMDDGSSLKTVEIKGNSFTRVNEPVYLYWGQPSETSSLAITGNTFVSAKDADAEIKLSIDDYAFRLNGAYGIGNIDLSGNNFNAPTVVEIVDVSASVEADVEEDFEGQNNVVIEKKYEGVSARIGDTFFTTLAEAVGAAEAGNTVTLLKNVEIDDPVTISKSLTIDGGEDTNLITGPNDNSTLYLNGGEDLKVTLKNLMVEGKYAVKVGSPKTTLNVDNALLFGYAAVYLRSKDVDNADGSTVTITNSALIGVNTANEGTSSDFGTISVLANNTEISIQSTDVYAIAEGTANQSILRFGADSLDKDYANAKVSITGNSILELDGPTAKFLTIGTGGNFTGISQQIIGAGVTANFNPSAYIASGMEVVQPGDKYLVQEYVDRSSSSSSSVKPEEPEQPEEPVVEPETPAAPGEVTVETEVTDGGEVELETPAAEGEGGSAAADEDETKITGVVLPTGTDSEVTFVPVSEQPAPAGQEENTKKVFEINVPTYEKGKAAVIKFTMTVEEIAADGKTAAEVALWHFDEETGEWTKLVTSYTIVDGVVYFEAITEDFSPFAIIYDEAPVDEPEQPTEEPETPASPAPVLGLLAALGAAVVLRRK